MQHCQHEGNSQPCPSSITTMQSVCAYQLWELSDGSHVSLHHLLNLLFANSLPTLIWAMEECLTYQMEQSLPGQCHLLPL
ncbi:hypothetical protein HA466_0165740 [Hirschfeldia incana]|nr:hypothetical protein HA466_0165740 [Hirschfeldia incana]